MTYSPGSHKSEDKVQFGMCDYLKQGHRRKSNFLMKFFSRLFFFCNLKVFKLCYLTHSTFPILLISYYV